jgi:hypothetical protein
MVHQTATAEVMTAIEMVAAERKTTIEVPRAAQRKPVLAC